MEDVEGMEDVKEEKTDELKKDKDEKQQEQHETAEEGTSAVTTNTCDSQASKAPTGAAATIRQQREQVPGKDTNTGEKAQADAGSSRNTPVAATPIPSTDRQVATASLAGDTTSKPEEQTPPANRTTQASSLGMGDLGFSSPELLLRTPDPFVDALAALAPERHSDIEPTPEVHRKTVCLLPSRHRTDLLTCAPGRHRHII